MDSLCAEAGDTVDASVVVSRPMKVGWVGFHVEGIPALEALLSQGIVSAVITLAPEAATKRSAAADYRSLCARFGVQLHEVANINDETSVRLLESLDLDLLFVIGWSQILRPPALRAIRGGVIGAHASMLPRNRGSAPINWALINGERATGNSLIWLADEVDAGDVIDQMEFPITAYDTCASLYGRVAETNRDMILRALPRLLRGERPGWKQSLNGEPVLPRRRPKDGFVDWRRDALAIYDFVRALTRPYPGAFGRLAGERWTIWQAALLPASLSRQNRPGTVLGPVRSPKGDACGQVVACGGGAVVLLELEAEDGRVLRGYDLADQEWTGLVWQAEDGGE
jgi:methionyl-tRNA formyltransferase